MGSGVLRRGGGLNGEYWYIKLVDSFEQERRKDLYK